MQVRYYFYLPLTAQMPRKIHVCEKFYTHYWLKWPYYSRVARTTPVVLLMMCKCRTKITILLFHMQCIRLITCSCYLSTFASYTVSMFHLIPSNAWLVMMPQGRTTEHVPGITEKTGKVDLLGVSVQAWAMNAPLGLL